MNNKKIFSEINYTRLSLCFSIIVILSLSIHAVMIQILHIPYPSVPVNALLPNAINNILMIWGVIWLDKALKRRLPNRSAIFRICSLFLLLLCLNETFRGWFMSAYCSNPSPKKWIFFAVSWVPQITFFAVATLLAAGTNHYFGNRWIRFILALIFGLLLSLVMPQLTTWFNNRVMAHLSKLVPNGVWCQLPYGINVLIPAYLTFIEPALAVILCIGLVRPSLARQTSLSALEFMLLILALKKQLVMAILYATYTPPPFMQAFISMGQFTLEAMLLSFFIAISWDYAKIFK